MHVRPRKSEKEPFQRGRRTVQPEALDRVVLVLKELLERIRERKPERKKEKKKKRKNKNKQRKKEKGKKGEVKKGKREKGKKGKRKTPEDITRDSCLGCRINDDQEENIKMKPKTIMKGGGKERGRGTHCARRRWWGKNGEKVST